MAFPKFQTKEVLNKVLNAGEDALNVDLADSVSVTVDSEFPDAVAITDNFANPTTTSAMSMLMAYDGSAWDRVTIGGGTEATALRVTIASNSTGVVTVDGTVSVSGLLADGHAVTIDNASDDEVYVRGSGSAGSADAGVITVQGITSMTPLLATVTGTATVTQQSAARTVTCDTAGNLLATVTQDSAARTITGTVEVVGDVAENENAAGFPVLMGGRYDNSGANDGGLRTLDTTDVGALALDPKGVLLTKDFTGQAGSILVTGTSAVAAGYGKFIAIQFIEDTVFSSSANGLSASDVNRWPDDTGIGSDISSNGAAIDSVTFPQGMTIFGRWNGFTLASGKVIGYIGYV